MLRMFLNRSNGCWAEAQSWNVPSPASLLDQDLFMGGDQWKVYQADVLRKLRLGQVRGLTSTRSCLGIRLIFDRPRLTSCLFGGFEVLSGAFIPSNLF